MEEYPIIDAFIQMEFFVISPKPVLPFFCLSLLLLPGIANAQATTNLLGIPLPKQTPTGKAAVPLPDTFSSQAHPAPTATPQPGQLLVSGKVRGYDFQRLNRVLTGTTVNQHSTEFSILPHVDYRIGDTPLNIGYTYGGASGFGFNGPNPIANPHVDNTLPGFPLDQSQHELYLQYKDSNAAVTVGNQELNYPWLPNSDSRVLPTSYEGVDAAVKVLNSLSLSVSRINKFEERNSSSFEANTLLTAQYPGTTLFANQPFTPGTLRTALNFHPSRRIVIAAENDQFYDIANLFYTEGKYGINPYSAANPYVAMQYVAENSIGTQQIGRQINHTIGAQFGANVVKNLLFAVSGDFAPIEYATVEAPTAAAAAAGYFVGDGGTGDAVQIAPGLFRVAYGGLASPYTDSLGTDPLYTTQITQGMADRRSAGNSYKAALVYTNSTKQLKLIADEGWYQYSNDISHNNTSEFNADGTYYFNKVRPGPYKGFFARIRIATRQNPTAPFGFEYQRFQTEYDF
jgi:hypothetical protein